MIPFNELRIGNYVLVNNVVRKIAMVSSIDDSMNTPSVGYYLGEDLEYMDCNNSHLQPLPLSNELLADSGFLFHDYFHLWQKSRVGAVSGMEMELDQDFNVVDFLRRPILKEVKSMHGLQNLYFALLGKEL